MFMQVMHKTYAGSGAICTGVAAKVEGTIPYEMARKETRGQRVFRIGHPSGIMPVECETERRSNTYDIKRAAIGRTARRIMDGFVYVPQTLLSSK
jgi:2-methylaconitate cis-trans-isomerase PrpF